MKPYDKDSKQSGYGRQRPGGIGMGRHSAGFLGPKAKVKDAKGVILRLWSYMGQQKTLLALVLLLVLGGTALGLVGPYVIGLAIDSISGGEGGVDFERLGLMALIMIFTYGVSAFMTLIQNYIMIGIAQRIIRDLRKELFERVQVLSLRFFDKRPHGELMSRLTNDVENINNTLTQSTTQLFASIITVVGSLAMMLWLSPLLTLVGMVAIPLGIFVTKNIALKTRQYFMTQQRELGELNGYIEETITGQRVVKAFTYEDRAIAHFSENNKKLKNIGIRAQIFIGIIPPMMNVINNFSFALVAGAGGLMAVNDMITIGVIASFLNYSRQFARPINEIANQFNLVQAALAGAERVFEVIDEKPEIEDDPQAKQVTSTSGEVIFKDVTFEYEKDAPVLKNVSFTAHPGQTIALVGPTGAGKTTIVNLLTRFYDINGGQILIDGCDIRKMKKDDLRKLLGIVLQDSYLFSSTVKENIRYGRVDATDAEIEEAARYANADTFIRRLPKGYDTIVTEGGHNLSQGQRQLITIARAVLANPAILILDEATSSVDTRTEMHIQKAMLSLMEGRTSFVIAHRLSTIREAHQILVIDKGQIIERGTHDQLIDAKGFYYNLYNSQFRKEA